MLEIWLHHQTLPEPSLVHILFFSVDLHKQYLLVHHPGMRSNILSIHYFSFFSKRNPLQRYPGRRFGSFLLIKSCFFANSVFYTSSKWFVITSLYKPVEWIPFVTSTFKTRNWAPLNITMHTRFSEAFILCIHRLFFKQTNLSCNLLDFYRPLLLC